MAFYVSPTFSNKEYAVRVGLFNQLKKTVIPRHNAEMDIPPRLSTPSPPPLSSPESTSSALAKFAHTVGFSKSPASSVSSELPSGVQSDPELARDRRGKGLFASWSRATPPGHANAPPPFGSSKGSEQSTRRSVRPNTTEGATPPRTSALKTLGPSLSRWASRPPTAHATQPLRPLLSKPSYRKLTDFGPEWGAVAPSAIAASTMPARRVHIPLDGGPSRRVRADDRPQLGHAFDMPSGGSTTQAHLHRQRSIRPREAGPSVTEHLAGSTPRQRSKRPPTFREDNWI